MKADTYHKGRGAQVNTDNRFLEYTFSREAVDGIDDWEEKPVKTMFFQEDNKSIVNKVTSPDLQMEYSLNPYQGCEHGCVYCYARNTHEYWGFSAGVDFESKIIIKKNAVAALKREFEKPSWKGAPISFSGNTDCYQPVEQKLKLTRNLLELCLEYKNPVSIITKNALVLRDIDLLKEMAHYDIVSVFTSVTSTDEKLRGLLEPRTTTYKSRFKLIKTLSEEGVPTGVMNAPIIPGINDTHMPDVLRMAADAGAQYAGYTMVRLNGAIAAIFRDWLDKTYPDKADKVWSFISQAHGGQVSDSRFGERMKGGGPMADLFARQFKVMAGKLGLNTSRFSLSSRHFKRPGSSGGQLSLF